MSGFYGADTDQVRDHSQLLRDRARSLTELRDQLQPAVLDESAWRGPDADAFRSTWSSQTTQLFDQIAEQLGQRSQGLSTHADEQDEASGVGEGGADGGGTGGEDASWWDRLMQGLGIYNDGQSLFSKGKKIWDLVQLGDRALDLLRETENMAQLAGLLKGYGDEVAKAIFGSGDEFGKLAQKLLGGLTEIPTGFGTSNFFGWADDAIGKVAPFMTDLAPWAGKALPALDIVFGGTQLIDGINSGDTFSAITGGASALGGGLMLAGGALSATGVGAVIGGPLATAGAIISGGAAVADIGRAVYDNWDTISSTASDVWNGAGDLISDGWDGLTGAFGF